MIDLQGILSQQEGRHLGDLCGWGLHGRIKQDEAYELAVKHRIADDLGFPRVGANSAYRRAVKKAVTGGADLSGYTAVLVDDDENKIVHAIVRSSVVNREITAEMLEQDLTVNEAEFVTETYVGFSKKQYKDGGASTETLLRLKHPDHLVAQRIKAFYDRFAVVYLPSDIRTAFQRAFEKWGAIRLLEHGGLWWVPAPAAEKVRAWKAYMADLRNTTVVIPVFDTSETIASLRNQSQETLEGQFRHLMEELEGFAEKGTVRKSTLEKRVEAFDTLRDRVELHTGVLRFQQEDLVGRLEKARNELVQSLHGLSE